MEDIEVRFAQELRFDEQGKFVEGVAVPYGQTTSIGGQFEERIMPGAFGKMEDVIANLLHDRKRPIARTGANGGMTLTDTDTELRVRIDLPETQDGRDAAELFRRRILRGFSVEMRVKDDRWTRNLREIRSADLRGLAVVDRPAYTGATAAIVERHVERLKHDARYQSWRYR